MIQNQINELLLKLVLNLIMANFTIIIVPTVVIVSLWILNTKNYQILLTFKNSSFLLNKDDFLMNLNI